MLVISRGEDAGVKDNEAQVGGGSSSRGSWGNNHPVANSENTSGSILSLTNS